MRVHVVSDVHGSTDALRRAGEGCDALVCLGDLILFMDYDDHGAGIMGDLFGAAAVTKLIELRTARRFDEAREWSNSLWSGVGDRRTVLMEAVKAQYEALFAVLPVPTYITYGNVDVPALWSSYARDGVQVLDGAAASIGGRRFGFVGGGLQTPMRTPNEISEEDYAAKVAAVGAVDVLCAHIPPAVPELLYDTLGRRMERGSEATLSLLGGADAPELMLYGHVHNPLVGRRRIGRTECVNVGHFRGRGEPYVLEW